MQTSEHIIAYQTVSSGAYQRLRETLLKQSSSFDSVEKGDRFVLLRSAALSVLLTATPMADSDLSQANTLSPNTLSQSASPQNTPSQGDTHSQSNKKALNAALNASPEHVDTQASLADRAAADYRVGLTFDNQAIAVFVEKSNLERAANLESARLEITSQASTSQASTRVPLSARHVSLNAPSEHFIPHPSGHFSPSQTSAKYPDTNDSPIDDALSTEEKIMAQKSFVLAWAKHLASSPEGDTQSTQTALDNQLQQSLLLDQVITRIRHSLDLPAILETTVAQVREFLSADRLVLYQFDHFHLAQDTPVAESHSSEVQSAGGSEPQTHSNQRPSYRSTDFSSPDFGSTGFSSTGFSSPDFSSPDFVPDNLASDLASDEVLDKVLDEVELSASADVQQTKQRTNPPEVGRFAHDGHITYESRMSSDVSSVLHLSERECFSAANSQRHARYLMGHPIAVDNIDEDYRDVKCLLDFLHQASVKSKIIAPIIVQGDLWGLLIAHQCQYYRHWEDSEAVFLQHIAEHLAVAISQASLYQQLLQQTVSLESCVIERTQSLQDALVAAESANITKGEFLSTMSHELKTPLTYIIGMSATLLRWSLGDLNERQRSYLKTINQSGEQLLTVINNILEFASVESGRSLLNAVPLSLSSFITQTVETHQSMAMAQEVSLGLTYKLAPEHDCIEADARRLQQIVNNLIHNAIKFTGSGGSVNVQVWQEAQTVAIAVEDTGIGIPESQMGELFEKFKQLERPFQRQYSGTGLGLAMTKRLVEMHGGTIEVRSEVAKGSTFTVRLPAHRESVVAPGRQSKSLEKALETNPNRVILLERDENNAAIACEMLTAAGYEIIWLIESHQLADQLGTLKPALLIADLSLLSPDPGYIKTIQHTITALNTKVLAISAEQAFNHSTMAHHDTLNKPLEPKALLSKVKQLVYSAS